MGLSRKQLIITGSVATVAAAALIVGITVGVVVGRRKSQPPTIEQRASDILQNYPLIDG
jgi:ABC-type dipeptide/oligopeptide/nickel transport system permease subunit